MDVPALIGVVVDGRWRPGIGDPTPLGWATVVAYLAASLACWRAARATGGRSGGGWDRPAAFWAVLSLILLLMGINKQLDLQSAVTTLGRQVARLQGWYDRRRQVQVLFILLVAGIGVAALGALGWLARGASRDRLLAMIGLIFLVGFVLIRASSFHKVDRFLGLRLGGLKWNWILELGGIGCVGLGALRARRAARVEVEPGRHGR